MKRLSIMLAAMAVSTVAYAQTEVLRVAHQFPPAHYMAKALDAWGEEIEKNSGGGIDVQMFPAAQAYKPNQVYPAVVRGQIEAGFQVSIQWGSTLPDMSALLIPFILSGTERGKAFPDSEAARMLDEELAKAGVHNMVWIFLGNANLISSNSKPLVHLEDFKDVKLRGGGKIFDSGFVAAGASTVIMSAAEVYQALDTGIVDAASGDFIGSFERKYYEVQKYGTVNRLNCVFGNVVANQAWWDGLSEENRKVIEEASANLEARLFEDYEKNYQHAYENMKDRMTLHIQTDEEAKEWEDFMKPAGKEEFLKQASPNGVKLVELLEKL
ncbi:TRAP transporter substrate-binding protein DctP [Aquibium sp. LZ166]|uniref:TRAP transporter substrate-binding protein DctP n=1 Tax=Aquibium pacificus TaxID=3153579 RepID=A0ABV3SRU8_9HYPH